MSFNILGEMISDGIALRLAASSIYKRFKKMDKNRESYCSITNDNHNLSLFARSSRQGPKPSG